MDHVADDRLRLTLILNRMVTLIVADYLGFLTR
jgi:hypothetical protein